MNKLLTNYSFWTILAASFLVVLPIILFGFPSGSEDLAHHLRLANAYFYSLKEGVFVPNWTAQENFGFGSVTLRFYPPVTQFSMAVFRLLFGNWQTAFTATFFFWSCVGGWGIYIFTADFFKNRFQPTVAAVLFILAHYHVNQLYQNFFFSEFAALSLLPFSLLYAKKTCENSGLHDVLKFGVSIALLILTNLPFTIISAGFVGFFVLFLLTKDNFLKQTGKLIGGCLVGLLLSSFYWLRMIFEVQWLNIYQPNSDPLYDFRNNFLRMAFEFDERGIWFVSAMFGLLVLFLLGNFIVSGSFKSAWNDKFPRTFLILFIVCGFLMFSVSTPVWENLAFLQRVQFPRRFLGTASICAAILVAFCFGFVKRENWTAKRPLILILIGMSVIYCFISVRQIGMGARFIDGEQFDTLFAESSRSEVLFHWQTTWMTKEAFERKNQFAAQNRNVEIIVWENEFRKIWVGEGKETKAEIGTFFYPHWQATANGSPIPIEKAADGTMTIDLPAGKSEIELKFVEPPISLHSRKISLAAWLLSLFGIFYGWFRKIKTL